MDVFLHSLKTIHACGIPRNDFTNITAIRSDYANWVIPGMVMCGPTPGMTGYFPIIPSMEYQVNMKNILDDGINTFVCLQEEVDPEKSYRPLLSLFGKPDVRILHWPMKDNSTPINKSAFLKQLASLLDMIREGRKIYIHCAGGHGRTGMYTACLLVCLYKEMRSYEDVLYYIQSVHDYRRKQNKQFYGILPSRVCSTEAQRDFVREFVTLFGFLS